MIRQPTKMIYSVNNKYDMKSNASKFPRSNKSRLKEDSDSMSFTVLYFFLSCTYRKPESKSFTRVNKKDYIEVVKNGVSSQYH